MEKVHKTIEIQGTVQGVGMRPALYRLAKRHGLQGRVFNHERGVTVQVEGPESELQEFQRGIQISAPPLARIESLEAISGPLRGYKGFEILKSPAPAGAVQVPITPDGGPCIDCLDEVHDPENRRYFYPFTSCVNCGPRFTICSDIPYDRERTSMEAFPMCDRCRKEYNSPEDRRYHAQPNACPDCGPQLKLLYSAGNPPARFSDSSHNNSPANKSQKIIFAAAESLREGRILALKGVGGYQLACDALNEDSVQELRARKRREEKPFAVMFPDLKTLREYARVTPGEAELLRSPAAPIVLLRPPGGVRSARGGLSYESGAMSLAETVAPSSNLLGAMLPSSPLHDLLLKTFGGPLVMTSGNSSDEPIVYEDGAALEQLADIADFFLVHDRKILSGCDDSLLRLISRKPYFLRRSRGYVPAALSTGDVKTKGRGENFPAPILGLGGELKNVFCLARGNKAYLSRHIGDLKHPAALAAFQENIKLFQKLYKFEPEYIACDAHPDFLNTRWAREFLDERGLSERLVHIQHHHAHIVSCMAESGHRGPVLGLALDGGGYGPDGNIWGGEILFCDRRDFMRAARLRPLPLPGGDQAIGEPWRIALGVRAAGVPPDALISSDAWNAPELSRGYSAREMKANFVLEMLDKNLNIARSSGCGRLFDAVAALLGLVQETAYEGQAAVSLEMALPSADRNLSAGPSPGFLRPYEMPVSLQKKPPVPVPFDSPFLRELDWRPLIREVVRDLEGGLPPGIISRNFHEGLVRTYTRTTILIAKEYQVDTVALSGGCFLNRYLLTRMTLEFQRAGLKTIRHSQVPPGDGGLALGQVVAAGEIIKGADSCVWQYQ